MAAVTLWINNIITGVQSNLLLTLTVILLLYFIKSFVMVIPLQALYLATGAVFGFGMSVAINMLGIAICLTTAYIMGRRIETDRLDRFVEKHPKLSSLDSFQQENSFFFSCTARLVGMVPRDIVSVYCGIKRLDYPGYIAGSLLGMLPGLLMTTVMGANIHNPTSPRFIVSVCLHIFTFILSMLIYNMLKKKNRSDNL